MNTGTIISVAFFLIIGIISIAFVIDFAIKDIRDTKKDQARFGEDEDYFLWKA